MVKSYCEQAGPIVMQYLIKKERQGAMDSISIV